MTHLVSTWTREFQPLADLTWTRNKALYAAKYGYQSHTLIHDDPAKIVWNRLIFLRERMESSPDGDWFMFSGTDAFITRPDYRLEQFIDEGADFICALNSKLIFGDWLLLRNCQAVRAILSDCIQGIGCFFSDEQVAFSCLLSGFPSEQAYLQAATGLSDAQSFYETAQALFNRNKYELRVKIHGPFSGNKFAGDLAWIHDLHHRTVSPILEWDKNTFMLHMGGKPLHFRLGLIPFYLPEI